MPGELVAVRTPIAGAVTLTRPGSGGQLVQATGLAVPAHGALSLSPQGDGLLIGNPAPYEGDRTVPLTLVFRDAGR